MAQGYMPGLQIASRQRARFYASETRKGGGSLYASSQDLLHFFQRAWRGRLEGAQDFPDLFGGTGETRAADGRAPGFYMDVHYERDADLLVVSTANNYAAESYWAGSIAQLALGRAPALESFPPFDMARAPDRDWVGRYRFEEPRYSQDLEISNVNAVLLLTDHSDGDARALLPLADGGYLDPLYYWAAHRRDDRIEFTNLYPSDFSTALLRK
jgi:hypothetical protein